MLQLSARIIVIALLFAMSLGVSLEARSQSPSTCSLVPFKNGQTVSLNGKVVYGTHDLLLTIKGCDEAVVLEYAGDADSGETRNSLVQNEAFRKFQMYLRSTYTRVGKGVCEQCPKYEVEAMLAGRFDIAPETILQGQWKDKLGFLHDQTGKLVGQAGFGHPPSYKYRLIIESVSQLKARKLHRPKPVGQDQSANSSLPSAQDKHPDSTTQLHESGHTDSLKEQ
jgi:hypothetical protein